MKLQVEHYDEKFIRECSEDLHITKATELCRWILMSLGFSSHLIDEYIPNPDAMIDIEIDTDTLEILKGHPLVNIKFINNEH